MERGRDSEDWGEEKEAELKRVVPAAFAFAPGWPIQRFHGILRAVPFHSNRRPRL
jgi:hypothetical protein